MKMNIRILVSVLAVFGFLIGCAEMPIAQMSQVKSGGEAAILTPLPKNVKIIPPAADVPKEIAAFSGMWQGVWDEKLLTVLVVEEIHVLDVKGIYAIGPIKETGKGGWLYFEGKINSGKLEFRLANTHLSFTLTSEGELRGFSRMFAPDDKTVLHVSRAMLKRRE